MAPGRRKGAGAGGKAAACKQWKVGDLVLAKVKGFPAWPAKVSRPEDWSQQHDPRKVFVYFYGTEEIGFCGPSDVQTFTVELRNKLSAKCRGRPASDFTKAVDEICVEFDELGTQNQDAIPENSNEQTRSLLNSSEDANRKSQNSADDEVTRIQKSQSAKPETSKEKKEKCMPKQKVSQTDLQMVKKEKTPLTISSAKRDRSMTTQSSDGLKRKGSLSKVDTAKSELEVEMNTAIEERNHDIDEPQTKRLKKDLKCPSERVSYGSSDNEFAQNFLHDHQKHKTLTSNVQTLSENDIEVNVSKQKEKRPIKQTEVNDGSANFELREMVTDSFPVDYEIVRHDIQEENNTQASSIDLPTQDNPPQKHQERSPSDYKSAQLDTSNEAKNDSNNFLEHQLITKKKRKSLKKHSFDSNLEEEPESSKPAMASVPTEGDALVSFPGTEHRKKRTQVKVRKQRCNMNEGLSSGGHGKELPESMPLKSQLKAKQQHSELREPRSPGTEHRTNFDNSSVSQIKSIKRRLDLPEDSPLRMQAKATKHKPDLTGGETKSRINSHKLNHFSPVLKKQRVHYPGDPNSETSNLVEVGYQSSTIPNSNASLNLNCSDMAESLPIGEKSSFVVEGITFFPPKPDKYRFRSNLPGDEATLPPSKRRYRAQEAMSACVAEAASPSGEHDTIGNVTVDDGHSSMKRMEGEQKRSPENVKVGELHVEKDSTEACQRGKSLAKTESIHSLPRLAGTTDLVTGKDSPSNNDSNLHPVQEKQQTDGYNNIKSHIKLLTEPVSANCTMDQLSNQATITSILSPKKGGAATLSHQVVDSVTRTPNMVTKLEKDMSDQSENKGKDGKLRKSSTPPVNKNIGSVQKENGFIDGEKNNQASLSKYPSGPNSSVKRSVAGALNINTKHDGIKYEGSSYNGEEKVNKTRSNVAKEVKFRSFSKADEGVSSMSMKHLIAAAQAKREQTRSATNARSFGSNEVETLIPTFILSPSPIHQSSSNHSSPSQPRSVSAVAEDIKDASSCGEEKVSGNSFQTFASGNRIEFETNEESKISSERKSAGRPFSGGTEAAVARDAFEGMLETLSRTKDSIGRASRLAIDCAKYGIASEIIELLIQRLESEVTLHKRIDLFFLVDSITQCSHAQKGIALASYVPAVQSALPRLLTAAAPRGSVARENRRQCLKVLRLWLERKILPEHILRRYMNEFGLINEERPGFSSRRPSRAERAVDDPVREIEGMLDEYGSNATFQLPGLLMQNIFEDEEDMHDTEVKKVEQEQPNVTGTQGDTSKSPVESLEKHRHILEDVDGELEMEDVSPTSDYDAAVHNDISIQPTVAEDRNTFITSDQNHCQPPPPPPPPPPPLSPPLPCEPPPSPPPLPSSPPPPPPSSPPPLPPPSPPFVCPPPLPPNYANTVNESQYMMLPGNGQPQCGLVVSNAPLPDSASFAQHPPPVLPPSQNVRPLESIQNLPGTSHTLPVVQQVQIHNYNSTGTGNQNMTFAQQAYCRPPATLPSSNQFSYMRNEVRCPMQQGWAGGSSINELDKSYFHEDQQWRFPSDRSIPTENQFSIQWDAAAGRFWPSAPMQYPPGSIPPRVGNIAGASINPILSQTFPERPPFYLMNSRRPG